MPPSPFGLADNPDSLNDAKELVVGGISGKSKIAVLMGLVIMPVVTVTNVPKEAENS